MKKNKKLIIGIVIVLLLLCLIIYLAFFRKSEPNSEESIKTLLQDYETEIGSLSDYTLSNQYEDTYKLTQSFNEIEVYGSGLTAIKQADEVAKVLNYSYQIPDDFNTNPKNTQEDLLAVAKDYVGEEALLLNSKLIIYPLSSTEFTLAYLFEFASGTIIISDEDQSIISAPSLFDTTTTLYREPLTEDDIKEFQTANQQYQLYDRTRNIEVYTIKDSYEYIPSIKFMQNNTNYYNEITWKNTEEANELDTYMAIKTMQSLAKVYDYYQKNFDFKSIKLNESYKLKVYTNLDKIEDGNAYYPFSNNAALFYFNSDDLRIYFGSENLFNEDLEVVSHEYTHGYFRLIVEPDGSEYNSAINEGYADTMGLIIGAYYRDGSLDGTIANRNVADSTFKLSDYTLDTEEHDASFLISRVAYLMSIDETLNMDLYDLGNLWFKSLYNLPKNIVNYSDVEASVLTEAIILGYSKDEVKRMAKIFESVGYPDLYDIIMKDVVHIRYGHTSVSEENSNINEEEIYMSYLKNREYENLTSNWITAPIKYALYDLDGNDILELMIISDDYGFGNTLILTYDPVEEKIKKVWDQYIYGGLRYHEGRKEIVYSQTKPFAGASEATFASLVNGEIVTVRSVYQSEETYYTLEGKDRKEITSEEYRAYFDDLIYFDEKDLNSI